ncbi:hypothetical protein MJO28_003263 [Puccinia striiformis f. sp. tritici]|uniref:Uncharacterized protein n=1 Tax=Puccinia striiformis f. sp. tritici TaxID=168172 RepID=A0ACC0ES74_9BASI|nr:hypothetical protein MJO28_003263 [Puccinia striiformis f. sp. tritici]
MNQPEPPSPPPGSSPSSRPAQNHYLLGIGLLLIVVALWVGSSFLMSSMFRDEEWNRPWLVTYICTSSFSLYLVPPGLSSLRSHFFSTTNSSSSILKTTSNHHTRKHSGPTSPVQATYTLLDHDHDGGDLNRSENRPVCVTRAFSIPESRLTTSETAHLASTFVLLWFAANWSVNAALGYTTVSSTTILSSMSGFFTLAIGVLNGAEKYSFGRLVAVITSIAGVILVSKSDRNLHSIHDMPSGKNLPPPSEHWILGDLLALSSAALYALYVILMKVKVKEESRVDMQLFFGFVGVINMLCFWPMGVILHYTDIEPFSFPQTHKLWISVILNAMCTFVSDYIYMLAMLKTSPLVVTLGISLTLPVAVIGDIFKGINLPPTSLIGAGLVLSSFVILSLFEQHHS